jgi:predicted GNAT family N-acyltransferase
LKEKSKESGSLWGNTRWDHATSLNKRLKKGSIGTTEKQIFGGNIIATARILPAGLSYPEVSIGRVVTDENTRGQGIGHVLMNECMNRGDAKEVDKEVDR